ncbi:hypothetical protein EON65_52755 [archaeon]|nr:MAG: hypothetical protein EON65_52755 [archaeon]
MLLDNFLGPEASDMAVYLWRSLLARYAYIVWLCIRCVGHVSVYMIKGVVKLHNEIRDQRYLLTTQLANRD